MVLNAASSSRRLHAPNCRASDSARAPGFGMTRNYELPRLQPNLVSPMRLAGFPGLLYPERSSGLAQLRMMSAFGMLRSCGPHLPRCRKAFLSRGMCCAGTGVVVGESRVSVYLGRPVAQWRPYPLFCLRPAEKATTAVKESSWLNTCRRRLAFHSNPARLRSWYRTSAAVTIWAPDFKTDGVLGKVMACLGNCRQPDSRESILASVSPDTVSHLCGFLFLRTRARLPLFFQPRG